MGEVYQARDTKLNRMVAVKVLLPDQTRNPEIQRRFFQEAQSASALNHPNIVTIHDVLTEDGADIMIMECIAGKTLGEVIPKGGLRVPQVLSYALQISDALSAAHAAGIIHRDLKPGNIMVTDRGLIKVLDFGLAKRITSDSDEDPEATQAAPMTTQGSILGTVAYMSPEQAQGGKIDPRSDVFAFGSVVYEMLTGQRAFEGGNAVSVLTAVLRDEPSPIEQVAPDVPAELGQMIARCLRKDPDERWQSMREVHLALAALKQGSDSGTLYRSQMTIPAATPASSVTVAPPAPKSKIPLLAAIGAVVVSLGGGAFWLFSDGKKTPAQPEFSQPAAQAPAGTAINNDHIIELVHAKASAALIISQIRSSKTDFDLSPDEVVRLLKSGVPENIIEYMRDPGKEPPAAVPAAAAPTPQATPRSAATTAQAPPDPAVAKPAAPANTGHVVVPDGTPFVIALAEDVAPDAVEGQVLQFTADDDLKVNGVTVVAKGAHASGALVDAAKKRKLIGRSKMTLRLTSFEAVDGKSIKLRATPSDRPGVISKRPLETPASKPKDVAAAKGTKYTAYIDGDAGVAH